MRVIKSTKNKLKEGRGQGTGPDYKSWLTVREVPTKGRATRVWGWKSDRVHTFLSDIERNTFYHLQWSDAAKDIREQFPLPLKSTLDIAARLGIRHPKVKSADVVMTTDFVVTTTDDLTFAYACKPHGAFADKKKAMRMLEKFEIERQYWQSQGAKWKIITDQMVHTTLARNVRFVRDAYRLDGVTGLPNQEDMKYIEAALRELLKRGKTPRDATKQIDYRLDLEPGTSLLLFRHFVATRRLNVDMTCPLDVHQPVVFKEEERV